MFNKNTILAFIMLCWWRGWRKPQKEIKIFINFFANNRTKSKYSWIYVKWLILLPLPNSVRCKHLIGQRSIVVEALPGRRHKENSVVEVVYQKMSLYGSFSRKIWPKLVSIVMKAFFCLEGMWHSCVYIRSLAYMKPEQFEGLAIFSRI